MTTQADLIAKHEKRLQASPEYTEPEWLKPSIAALVTSWPDGQYADLEVPAEIGKLAKNVAGFKGWGGSIDTSVTAKGPASIRGRFSVAPSGNYEMTKFDGEKMSEDKSEEMMAKTYMDKSKILDIIDIVREACYQEWRVSGGAASAGQN